jgi:hypothetical protein
VILLENEVNSTRSYLNSFRGFYVWEGYGLREKSQRLREPFLFYSYRGSDFKAVGEDCSSDVKLP